MHVEPATIQTEEAFEAYINESISRCQQAGYTPVDFIKMRKQRRTRPAIELLLLSGEMQSGFRRLRDMGMLDWTIEAAVLKFPKLFRRDYQEAAKFRLDQVEADK